MVNALSHLAMTAAIWDWNIGLGCSECDASLWEDDDRAFSYAPRAYLCYECATRRGGVYDASADTWTTPPDVRSLGRRRSHARREGRLRAARVT
jgi:hypothetical protein